MPDDVRESVDTVQDNCVAWEESESEHPTERRACATAAELPGDGRIAARAPDACMNGRSERARSVVRAVARTRAPRR